MNTIAVSDLRANLMKVLEEIKQGAQIKITSRGKVIAQLVPADTAQEHAKEALHQLGSSAVIGDVIKPIDENWDAISQ
ncbi:MAG: type II toxin-antitoxin system prevent-host-death family antitoxin [Candidatus Marinimicrobia bacterium]|nr:type II toxin-antitoxin system prevent-host-death family antitoxin [Candidatus Neomarinimicrobiota bacterium]